MDAEKTKMMTASTSAPNMSPLDDLKKYLPFQLDDSLTWSVSEYDAGLDQSSPYHVSNCMTSLLVMQGLLVADIWKAQTGEAQSVSVDRKRAMEYIYRVNFLWINGKPLSLDAFKLPTSLTNKTKDGFIETTTTLRHIHEGVLNLLKTHPEESAVKSAFLKWTSDDLEKALNEQGLGGVKIRTREEFRAHPQGVALAKLDPFTLTRLNDAPSRPWSERKSDRPLGSIKILDLSQIIAAPLIGNILAEQGAQVLHINNPHGERVQSNYMDTGFGKKCAALDLGKKEDLDTFYKLISEADVFVQGYAPGRLEKKFGITTERLLEAKPDLIIVNECAFGSVGPWKDFHGWENIAQAAIGSCFDHGTPEEPTLCPYGFLTDFGTGLMGAVGVLTALEQRAKVGGAHKVELSLARVGMWIQDQGLKPDHVVSLPDMMKVSAYTICGGNKCDHMLTTKTAWGDVEHMAPVIQYSKTPAFWDKPCPVLGSSYPKWW